MADSIGLSKSKYCNGYQCPKMLWMQRNMPDEAVPTADETVLENGTMVGEVARGYFGDFVEVPYDSDKQKMMDKTNELIEAGADNIAEASFSYDGCYCAVDILHKNGNGWDIVEVKSSTSVHDIYKEDVAYQYYVLTNCGINVKRAYLMHINNKYVRHGALNLKELFVMEDLTDETMDKQPFIPGQIANMRKIACQTDEPEKKIDRFCFDPYECAFKGYCWRHIPSPSIFDIANLRKDKMFINYQKGIVSFEDVLASNVKLSDKQKMQVEHFVKKSPDHIDVPKIKAFLKTLTYPLYHLDFETFMHAVPQYDGEKPYMQIPFQYSLHIEYEDGKLDHKEFLAEAGADPRRMVAERLCADISMGACTLAFNMSFEQTRLKELAALFPDLAEHLNDISKNMHDIMIPFQSGDYYSNAMQGSYSIKYVLPALYPNDPELDYHNLEDVHNGGEASAAFLKLEKMSAEESVSLRENMLKYCGLDTYAMVKVLTKLREVCK